MKFLLVIVIFCLGVINASSQFKMNPRLLHAPASEPRVNTRTDSSSFRGSATDYHQNDCVGFEAEALNQTVDNSSFEAQSATNTY